MKEIDFLLSDSQTCACLRKRAEAAHAPRPRRRGDRMRRRAFIALMPNIIVAPRLAFAQELAKVARIGFLGPTPAASVAPRVEALRVGLRDLGYAEGKNLIFEFRWAATPDQMPALVAD